MKTREEIKNKLFWISNRIYFNTALRRNDDLREEFEKIGWRNALEWVLNEDKD